MELFQGYISEVNMDEGELHLDVIFDDTDWYSAPAAGELQHVPPPPEAQEARGQYLNRADPRHRSGGGGPSHAEWRGRRRKSKRKTEGRQKHEAGRHLDSRQLLENGLPSPNIIKKITTNTFLG